MQFFTFISETDKVRVTVSSGESDEISSGDGEIIGSWDDSKDDSYSDNNNGKSIIP